MENYNWFGSRERDNFSYTKGASAYNHHCNNSLIISNSSNGFIEGVNNHALINNSGKSYLISITKIDDIINLSKEILKGGRVFYQKPKSIFEIQNIENLNEEEIRQKISENYCFEIKNLSKINTKKGKNRIYKIVSKDNKEFILKYHGRNSELFESQLSFLKRISSFPRIIPTVKSVPYIFFNENIYALEEFIDGEKYPLDRENYFGLVGKHLALIHNDFRRKGTLKNNLENILTKKGNFLNESNLISMQIDLENNLNNSFFLRELASFSRSLSQIVDSFPDQIIHGDLNKSNLIWNGNSATIIDSETIRFSKRIMDFIPALLFEGNLNTPNYIPNSLNELIDSYNSCSNQKLNEAEITILPDLLKFSLIKSYIIYVLRRNLEDEKFKNKIIHNLKLVEGEKNVH
jgi:Ser/Thr protein kinase RdoA (MazF antagonist)